MSVAGPLCFNLIVNASVTLALTLLGVALALRVFRIPPGRAAALLLAVPFLKAGYELVRGVPVSSFFWSMVAGQRPEVSSLRFGLGLSAPAIPNVHLALGAVAGGRAYPQSTADMAAAALARGGEGIAGALGLALALVVGARAVSWLVRAVRTKRRLAAVVASGERLPPRSLGWRPVRLVVADVDTRVPFAGGLVHPWICLPRATFERLSEEEREAVIAHELSHLRRYDALLLSPADFLAHVFSFVPGARRALRAIRAHVELAADADAARVVPAADLASALVRVAEIARGLDAAPGASPLALLTLDPVLPRRVGALLEAPATPPSSMSRARIVIVTAMLCAAVMQATTFGNP